MGTMAPAEAAPDAAAALHIALGTVAKRRAGALVELWLDAARPWPELEADLCKLVMRGRKARVLLYGADLADASALAALLQKSYEALQAAAVAVGLALDSADVLPCFTVGVEKWQGPGLQLCRLGGPRFERVVLGGTFDHLHAGHKVLLTVAACLATAELAVSISGPPLLEGKRGAGKLQPWGARARIVAEFVALVRPGLPLRVEELLDGFGPALRPQMQALVVSAETEAGGFAVNERRREAEMPPLTVVVIPLVAAAAGSGKESSTAIRQQLVGLGALARCWSLLADAAAPAAPAAATLAAARWATGLRELALDAAVAWGAVASPKRRRPVLERVQSDLERAAADVGGAASTSTDKQEALAEALALCAATAWPLARRCTQSLQVQQATLVAALADDLKLSSSIVRKAQDGLSRIARPRVLGLAGPRGDSKGGPLAAGAAAAVRRALASWGAVTADPPGGNGADTELQARIAAGLESGAPLVVLDLEAGGAPMLCDEVWAVLPAGGCTVAPDDVDAVLQLPPMPDGGGAAALAAVLAPALRRLCVERGLAGLTGLTSRSASRL